ncbi:MAG: WbqC family protein [bacterium]|nr:WbqC family protein [bacterium]
MTPVFPTTYFGSIIYYQNLVRHAEVLIETKEHFPKQSYRNRCDILSADGLLSLSIPVKKPNGSKTPTDEVQLANNENWRARHWRAIKTAYQSAPYFDYYGIEVHDLIYRKDELLIDLNDAISSRIIDWLDLPVKTQHTKDFHPIQENDPREVLVDKNKNNAFEDSPYIQVFPSTQSFTPNISILDAVMCSGPLARNLLLPVK